MAIPKFEDFLFPFMMHLTDQDSNKSDMVSVLSDFFNPNRSLGFLGAVWQREIL